jgi:hypothetical protein
MESNKNEIPQSQKSESENSTSDGKKTKGRQLGAKKQDVPHVVELPSGCPTCEHTKAIVVKLFRQRYIDGYQDGRRYNRVTWRRVKCQSEACGQVYIKRSYEWI